MFTVQYHNTVSPSPLRRSLTANSFCFCRPPALTVDSTHPLVSVSGLLERQTIIHEQLFNHWSDLTLTDNPSATNPSSKSPPIILKLRHTLAEQQLWKRTLLVSICPSTQLLPLVNDIHALTHHPLFSFNYSS